jgi:hypothetical protein
MDSAGREMLRKVDRSKGNVWENHGARYRDEQGTCFCSAFMLSSLNVSDLNQPPPESPTSTNAREMKRANGAHAVRFLQKGWVPLTNSPRVRRHPGRDVGGSFLARGLSWPLAGRADTSAATRIARAWSVCRGGARHGMRRPLSDAS